MKYVVFEGLDGAGKTTTLQELKAGLQNRDEVVFVSKEPPANEIGGYIRKRLQDKNFSKEENFYLNEAARIAAFQSQKEIAEYLGANYWLQDRSFISGIVYYLAMSPEKDWDEEFEYLMDSFILPDFKKELYTLPDLVVFLWIEEGISIERITKRALENDIQLDIFETEEYLKKIKKIFMSVLKKLEKILNLNILVLNGADDLQENVSKILKEMEEIK